MANFNTTMETIKERLREKTTEDLLKMIPVVREGNDEGTALVWNALIDVLEERIGDKVWDL